jgi:LacI family transcriptional regulator
VVLPSWPGDAPAPNLYRIADVLRGCRDALIQAGNPLPEHRVARGDETDASRTFAAVRSLMDAADPPTALFVADDAMAIMAIHALARAGLRVPQDVSVVGYGDWPAIVPLADPPLTTVRVPVRESGRRAARLLMDMLEHRADPQQITLQPELVVRESTLEPSPTGRGQGEGEPSEVTRGKPREAQARAPHPHPSPLPGGRGGRT